ncbi:DnaA/Hda family protein [Botrimarina sp.]|uniref:DnaA ATPase domain-containing protein n=1 Tax=Botrimarina sp. TaxID=2795802 RepID=UPI0032EF4783
MEGVCESVAALRDQYREGLRRRIGEHRFATWFEGTVGIAVEQPDEGNPPKVRLTAPSAFELGLVRKQFLEDLQATARLTLNEASVVDFAVALRDQPASPGLEPAAATSLGKVGEGLAVRKGSPQRQAPLAREEAQPPAAPPEATARQSAAHQSAAAAQSRPEALAGWVEGPCNAAATHLCRRLLAGGPVPSPTLLWGPAGVGKSHLLRALAEAGRRRRRRVVAIGAEQFLRGFVEAARGDGMAAFRTRYAEGQWLLVDDLQHLAGKARTIEEFRQTVDAYAERGGTVVMAADRGPGELRDLGPELASRLAGGLPVELTMPHPSVREELVRRAAEGAGLDLPPHAAKALACRLIGGGREARGAVNRMALLHQTLGLPLDERLAEQVADDSNRLSTPPVRLGDIQRAVCGVFGVDARTLRSDKRTKSVTEPRMLAMWLARKMTGAAWSEIGDHFGRKSHSTVISAHRRVERLLASPTPTRLSVGDLGETIRRVEAALRSA